ncbi:MAG: outer membrane protein assembly factor BamD, partial [Gammaproteobacteria bacterium]|nr:outer membrane protein assembly factor BamD [Gammaproteobacteria bacterium]
AIEYFESLEARYPFGEYTQQAQLDIAYAYLKQDEFDNAIAAADQFIKLHPRSPAVAYAYYLKGLSNFSRGQSTMERLFPRDMSRVDQSWLRSAFADFDTLIRRYPNSKYVDDAKQRMVFLRSEMAHHELITAEYYYVRGAMVAAINRAQYLLDHYDKTPYTADALAVMAKAYQAMGKDELASKTLDLLAQNDPEHEALQPEKSLLEKVLD